MSIHNRTMISSSPWTWRLQLAVVLASSVLTARYCHGSSPRCTGPGLFPNPRTCWSYILCRSTGDIGEILPCVPAGTGFDSRSGLCTLNRRSKECREGSVPACLGAGHYGISPVDPTLFFVCHARAPAKPSLYRCRPGLSLDFRTEKCVSEDPCNVRSQLFSLRRLPVPGSCHQYTLCMPGARYVVTCPGGSIFNPHLGICTLTQNEENFCLDAPQQMDYFRARKRNETFKN